MKISILTIFPEVIERAADFSILKRAVERGLISIEALNIRDFTEDKHRMTDDTPYGGSGGMIMKPEPIYRALEAAKAGAEPGRHRSLLMSASGTKLTQKKLEEYSKLGSIAIVCGRYEGVDERVLNFVDEEICIGDYVLSGGEFPAMVIAEGVTRLIPGALGNEESAVYESHTSGILDFPQYTKPREFMGLQVPEVLASGNHEEIRKFRLKQALKKTLKNRPELLETAALNKEEKTMLESIIKEGEKQ